MAEADTGMTSTGLDTGNSSDRPVTDLSARVQDLLVCPDHRVALDAALGCPQCSGAFQAPGGVPCLLPGAGETNQTVRAFYEEQPFPDYEDMDSPRALYERARRSGFAELLDRCLSLDGVTLEAGCGTGQLSNFLALAQRDMVGLDFSRASLTLAEDFRSRFEIGRANFVQGDLFHPPFADESFDDIVSLGVLHHTDDSQRAFESLVRLLKPGGHFILGLYNRYARIPTKLRGYAIRALGHRVGAMLDPVVRKDRRSQNRQKSWLNDQYFHPLERTHTVDEVLSWFDQAGVDYVNAMPKFVYGEAFSEEEDLFEPGIRGSRMGRTLAQCGWAFTYGWEGGLFVIVGRKR